MKLRAMVVFPLILASLVASKETVIAPIGSQTISVKADLPSTTMFSINSTGLNSSDTIQLSLSYDDAVADVYLPPVHLMILHGNQSSFILLSSAVRSGSVILCFETLASGLEKVVVVARSGGDIDIKLEFSSRKIILNFGAHNNVHVAVTVGHPVTFLVNPVTNTESTRHDRYLLKVESDSDGGDVCMIVAAYGNTCPFKDREESIKTADMWFTALKKGAMTIRSEEFSFSMPFYVSVAVLAVDGECHLTDASIPSVPTRRKNVTVSIVMGDGYSTYVAPIGTSILVSAGFIIFACVIMGTKKLGERGESDNEEGDSVYYSPSGSRPDVNDLEHRIPKKKPNTENEEGDCHEIDAAGRDVIDNGDVEESLKPMVATAAQDEDAKTTQELLKEKCRNAVAKSSSRQERVRKGLDRLDSKAKLSQMTKILEHDVWFRRNRSRVYCYLVPLLSLFYFIPAIQFVFLVKETESLTGSQDFCFHNFQCAKALNIFSDFNHVISNISYMLFGLAFMVLVRYKARKLPEAQKPKHDHKSDRGILQQLSIFYAMGFALCAQGFFSICYHVCPTNHSLQFDSTMMYVICMLGIVKIYQFRHPDANANAYSFFFFLGGIVLLEALALYSDSWWVYGFFLLCYVVTTLFIAIDCYFMGVGRLDHKIGKVLAKDLFTHCFRGDDAEEPGEERSVYQKLGIRYPKRFVFASLFCLLNFGHATYVAVAKWKNPSKTVTNVVLLTLAGNLFLYIFYYVIRKNYDKYKNYCGACRSDDDKVDARYQVRVLKHEFFCCLSAGSVFALLALALGVVAGHFYLARNANRNLSPAESRNLNEECSFAHFFDNHDMWHFASAGAIFMAFLALLTVDDDLITVPRSEIEVF